MQKHFVSFFGQIGKIETPLDYGKLNSVKFESLKICKLKILQLFLSEHFAENLIFWKEKKMHLYNTQDFPNFEVELRLTNQ